LNDAIWRPRDGLPLRQLVPRVWGEQVEGTGVAELTLHDVEWFAERGHPLLVLGVVDRPNEYLTVALSTGDAQALAITPGCDGVERLRLFGLVETMLNQLDAHLTGVEFTVGPTRSLQATLHIATGHDEFTVPANFADAVALGCRAAVPLTMSDAELAQAVGTATAQTRATREESGDAIRAFVETLDLGWIDTGGEFPAGSR
jgi:hypothetical protein